jgi:hypothetical protein
VADRPAITDTAVQAYIAGIINAATDTHLAGRPIPTVREIIRAGLAAAAPHIAAQETARANKAQRERDSLTRRLSIRFGELEEARAALRQATDELDQLNRRPSTADQRKAEAALIDAWPDLAEDPVHVEQLAAIALNAAYNPAWKPSSRPGSPPTTRTSAADRLASLHAQPHTPTVKCPPSCNCGGGQDEPATRTEPRCPNCLGTGDR